MAMSVSVHTATVVPEKLALLAQVLGVDLALVRDVQAIWFVQGTLEDTHKQACEFVPPILSFLQLF